MLDLVSGGRAEFGIGEGATRLELHGYDINARRKRELSLEAAEQIANIAEQTSEVARSLGHNPRIALISYSNFGHPELARAEVVRDAVKLLDKRNVSFEYEGEMTVEVALNEEVMKNYPFCRLTGPANILIMPSLHTSQVSTQLLKELGGGTVLGPVLMGLSKPAQIVPMGTTVSDMVNMAALAAQSAD